MEHFLPTCELRVYSTSMRSHTNRLCQGVRNTRIPGWGNEKQGYARISNDQRPLVNVSIS